MTSRHKGRPSKVWTAEQRRKLSDTMRRKHELKMNNFATQPKEPEPLTPEELAEQKAEEQEKADAARDFAYDFRRLACEHVPIHPAAEALFRACGVDDVATMRELAEWTFMLMAREDER
jgi:hypothetical protein